MKGYKLSKVLFTVHEKTLKVLELESIQKFELITFSDGKHKFNLSDKIFRQPRLEIVEHMGFVE